MNKIPLTIQAGDNLLRYPGINDLRNSLARSSRDVKAAEIKSPMKLGSNSSSVRNLHHSPSDHLSRGAYSFKHTKSPVQKPNLVVFALDHVEAKENQSFDAKLSSINRLENKRNVTALNSNKSIATTSAAKTSVISQVQTHRNRSPQYDIYEAFTSRKPNKNDSQAHGSLLLNQKDVKSSFSSEPFKKPNPSSLKLTLDKICKKEGSSTHRTVMNSPNSEIPNKSIHQKSTKDLSIDTKTRHGQSEKNVKNAKHKLNTMLVGLSKANVSQEKGSSRQSARNLSSVNVTPRQNYSGVYSIDEESETMRKYKKLLGVLKEKNKEIKQLSLDKSDLQSTICIMQEEMTTLRKEKVCSKGKEDSLVDSQLEESRNQSSRNIERSPFSPSMIHSTSLYQKSMIDLSNGDIKSAKVLTNPLGILGKNIQVSDRGGKSWMSSIDPRLLKGRKRSDNAEGSLEYPQFAGKNSSYISLEHNMQENSFRQRYNENGSNKEKLSYLKEIDEEFEDHHNRRKYHGDILQIAIDSNPRMPADNQRKKARKVPIEKKERENTSLDDRALLRNSSTDPKLSLEKRIAGKNTGLNSSMAYFSTGITSQGEGLDIGGALNELKDRIKRMLVKRNEEENMKAHLYYENLYDRLQKVI